ncbi:MAG: cation diffusion facilitator family transporter [Leptotrichia wadei]|uniref:cation diffusion facilitator family transporter n=1 Tax=Leptotrichia wadei TaxID=157687 RepID=UPI0026ED281A|nr:cation diffusion facilitator family transporter [Leptotrichia wadei]MBS6019141.1 cation diffusion facilitator family transporter [Leptotrichia wadei]
MDSKEFAFELNNEENFDDSFDFDELEEKLQSQLKLELSELEILKENQKQIGDPDNLGKVVEDVIWEQVNNQIAIVAGKDFIKENGDLKLDLRSEAHIQTTENFKKGKIATHNKKINYQERYNEWERNFQRNADGTFRTKIDNRTGEEQIILRVKDKKKDPNGEKYNTNYNAREFLDKKRPKGSKTVHKDHTISAAEIIRDPESNAHMTRKEQENFANDKKNLVDLDSSANQSKSDSKMIDWLDSKRDGKSPKERFDIDEKKLRERDKIAREEYEKRKRVGEQKSIEAGEQSQKEEAFRIGGTALRAVVMGLLADLIREIVTKLVKWFKTTKGKFEMLWDSLKEAIHSFIGKMKTHLINAGNVLFTTIATAIVGPVFRTLKQVWMLLKQGWQAIKNAIDYIKSPENKNKPIGRLILETGKIVIAGLTGAGAIVLSEVIEKGLSSIPILLVEIPLLGSLANIIGIFMGAVVSGIIGAIAINLIERMIKRQYEMEITDKKIDKSNEILGLQHKIINLNENKVVETKERMSTNIKERHRQTANYIKNTFNKIFNKKIETNKNEVSKENSNKDKFDEINSLLDELMLK